MAIRFDPKALSAFSNVNFGSDNAIANLGDGSGELKQKGELGSFLWKPFRLSTTEGRNNAVRTELLKALGKAFNLNVQEIDGKATFSDEFMDRLEEILGPAFKRGDFGVKNGEVASGKPLTQRRITAIVNAARVKGGVEKYDGATYLAKVDVLVDWFKNEGPQDAQSTILGVTYFEKVRKTIEFLGKEMDEFDNMDSDQIASSIFENTGMAVDVHKIADDLKKNRAIDDPSAPVQNDVFNIDDIGDMVKQQVAPIKKVLKEKLEALVKKSVDLCFEAKEAGQMEDFIDAVYRGRRNVEDPKSVQEPKSVQDVEKTLATLEEFKKGANRIEEAPRPTAGGIKDVPEEDKFIEVNEEPKPRMSVKDEDDIIIKTNDIPKAPEEENKIVEENKIPEVEDKKEPEEEEEVDEDYKRFLQMQKELMEEEEDSFDDGDKKVFSLKAQPTWKEEDLKLLDEKRFAPPDDLMDKVKGQPESIQKEFKLFYATMLRDFEDSMVDDPPTKADCDNILRKTFTRFGGFRTKFETRLFIDLLCSRKIEIMNREARILDMRFIVNQIDNICAVIEKIKKCMEEHGETVARAVFYTIKSQDGMIDAETEFPEIGKGEVEAIKDAAEKYGGTNGMTILKPGAQGFVEACNNLARDAGEEFDEELRSLDDPALKNAAKKNIFTALVFVQRMKYGASFFDLKDHYAALAQNRQQKDFLNMIVPAVEKDINLEIAD